MINVVEDLAQRFSGIIIVNGAIRDGESWRKNFEDLTQLDNMLIPKASFILFNSTLHTFKIVMYFTALILTSTVSAYYTSATVLIYSHIFHRTLLFLILVVVIFFVDLMKIIRRRYNCLGMEITKILTKYNNLEKEKVIKDMKLIYSILCEIVNRMNIKFGIHIFFIISCLLMKTLDTFNWFWFGSYKDYLVGKGHSHMVVNVV